MKICLVTQQLKNVYSGVGLYSRNILNYLSRENHTITVIVPENQILSGEQIHKFVTVKSSSLLKSQARWLYYSWQFNQAINFLEQKELFDVIHFTDSRDSYFCNTHSPKIGNVNDTYTAELYSLNYYKKNYIDWAQRYIYYRFVHFLEKRKLSNLDCIIANSCFTYHLIEEQYSPRNSQLFMCYKSVDVERYKKVRFNRNSESTKEKLQILFVGGNMQRKGLIDLIGAAAILKRDYPDIQITVAGEDKFIPRYQEICKENNVGSNFNFLGWVSQDQLLDLYRSASVFIMPSLTEALGVVFLEAMAAGVPVIGTNVGGIPEIIKHGQNGLLVPISSPESIADEVRKLMNNPNLRRKIIMEGFKTVKNFSVDQMMRCTKKLYSLFN